MDRSELPNACISDHINHSNWFSCWVEMQNPSGEKPGVYILKENNKILCANMFKPWKMLNDFSFKLENSTLSYRRL